MNVKIATAQYDISFLENWQQYQSKVERWVLDAAQQDAKILLFPEYASMELASLFIARDGVYAVSLSGTGSAIARDGVYAGILPGAGSAGEAVYSSLSKQLAVMQSLLEDYLDLFQMLAKKYQCIIQSGTFPVKTDSGAYRNRAYLFMPNGQFDYQDKLMMTRFENEQWLIQSGEELRCFDSEYGKIAINVCYDSEFPMLARKQVEAGANLILVPSCTDTLAGYHRVKIGCQARALENQCYVVQAALVGNAPWSEAVDVNIGAAAVYTPVDRGFPDNGILAAGKLNAVQWVVAEVSLGACATVREQGQVFNYKDWSLQHAFVMRS
ncbi:MAG: carbon-nitrogen hydrolase family protein [Methylobacter sp.]|uniref:Carbon-nitrogen hydrolase family protein n=1 Tax=Candidatus Methylobacter titanis TaxID=3053457 RepID=A0AA43Q6W2_9GAMM|nr:carbon-nitrogen hydrolase family protein [Candidatus Methylobacter titanis]MDI1292536.1 carbon-nitrogen hydrolase family protein [Candidatus Methylobacter titanis]